ncbi:MAG TPA: hypothetical protein VGB79_01185 [Allosphingosinicella sp.]|jgi:hypothetical protein
MTFSLTPIRVAAAAALLAGFASAAPAQRQRPGEERPAVLGRVVQCRSIASEAERLACFDREVAALDQAQSSGELLAMDRSQVRRTRRSLFGLTVPNLGIFGDDNEDEEEASRIETTIRSATQNAMGKWVIELADGARWLQIDSMNLNIRPRPGQPIRIRRAAMGSYLANVNNQTAIRMRRMN